MLLKFCVSNYRSFLGEAEIDFTAIEEDGEGETGLDYSILTDNAGGKTVKALCSSVFYGANASGKTNIISAMDTMRSVVLRGNILDADEGSPDRAADRLELIPNKNLKSLRTTDFEIAFLDQGLVFTYSLKAELGLLMDSDCDRKIRYESLLVNGKKIYERDGSGVYLSPVPDDVKEYFLPYYGSDGNKIEAMLNASLEATDLFLQNGFRLFCSPQLTKRITDWFRSSFLVICHANEKDALRNLTDRGKGYSCVSLTVNEAMEIFGTTTKLYYAASGGKAAPVLYSVVTEPDKDGHPGHPELAIAFDQYESSGTIRFINVFPLVLRALKTGATLVVDELDASIHPMVVMNIVNMFHNDEINIHHAQLIFNTHNPIYLNPNLFRRDEIRFVAYDPDQKSSETYSLADFRTDKETDACRGDDYMRQYFAGRYGALPEADFTELVKKYLGITDREKPV